MVVLVLPKEQVVDINISVYIYIKPLYIDTYSCLNNAKYVLIFDSRAG